jgi:hypothetical protein
MTVYPSVGNVITLTGTFTDGLQNPVAPDVVTVTITRPDGSQVVETIPPGTTTGIYSYSYLIEQPGSYTYVFSGAPANPQVSPVIGQAKGSFDVDF